MTDPGENITRHTLWGLPHHRNASDSSSKSSGNTCHSGSSGKISQRSSLGPGCDDDDAPPGERAHPGVLDENEPDEPSQSVTGKTGKGRGMRRGRAGKHSASSRLNTKQELSAQLEKYGLNPDEVQVMSESSLSQSNPASEQEETPFQDYGAFEVVCSVEPVLHCAGSYDIATRCANGRPVWQCDGGNYWLYGGIDGKWYISDRQVSDCDFTCAFGFIRSTNADGKSVPGDELEWEWWDGNDWQADATIRVQAAPKGIGVRNSTSSSAQGSASSPALDIPNEGSQGHHLGTCKPCAWYYNPGCENRETCPFCHLCPKGEIQRRRDARKKRIKESKEAKRQRDLVEAAAKEGTRLWL